MSSPRSPPGAPSASPNHSKEAGMSDRISAEGRTLPPVVTLFESYGSGASYIGPRVAQALGVPFHTQAFSSEELENAETKRENEGVLGRVFAAMGGSYAGIEG